MKKESIKDYIRKQIKKEMDKVLYTPGKVTNFTINWEALDKNLLSIPPITLKDLEPKDTTISFVIKSEKNGTPEYMTLSGCKFTSYNKAHLLDSYPDYITTSVSIDPKKCGWNTRKRKTKPRFTTAQRKSMR